MWAKHTANKFLLRLVAVKKYCVSLFVVLLRRLLLLGSYKNDRLNYEPTYIFRPELSIFRPGIFNYNIIGRFEIQDIFNKEDRTYIARSFQEGVGRSGSNKTTALPISTYMYIWWKWY